MNAVRSRRFARFLSRAVIALAAARAHAAKPGEIVMGTLLPSGTEQYRLLQELGQQWRKDSGGAVKLILHPDGRLGGEAEMVKKIGIGQINSGLFTAVGLSDINPDVAGLQLLPLTFRSWAEVDYVREQLRPILEARLRAKGFTVLCWADAGWVRFFSTEPTITPAEFRRTKLFVWAGDEPQIAIMKAMGCRPVALETSDVVVSLQTKLINAAPLPPMVALASQAYSPAPHMLDLNWVPIVGAAVVRTDAWEKIPATLRPRLLASAEATGQRMRQRGRTEDDDAVRAMRQHGLQVHAVSPAAAEDWQQFKEQIYPRIRGRTVPAEIFDAVQQHLRAFRAGAQPAQ